MSIVKFDNTVSGKAKAEATPDPKYIAYGARITVFTGADIPPADAVVDPSLVGSRRPRVLQQQLLGYASIDATAGG